MPLPPLPKTDPVQTGQQVHCYLITNPIEAVKIELGYLADVKIDLQQMWNIAHVDCNKPTADDLPYLTSALMLSVKSYRSIPGWVKKEVVVAVLRASIDPDQTNQPETGVLKQMVPHLVDCLYNTSKSGVKFKRSSSYYTEYCL